MATYKLPNGDKVRIASRRRFVLVHLTNPPTILKRSDSVQTVLAEGRARWRPGSVVIVDQNRDDEKVYNFETGKWEA